MTTKYFPILQAHTVWTSRANVVATHGSPVRFRDLTFTQAFRNGRGVRAIIEIPNNLLISVICHPKSYGWHDGTYEAVKAVESTPGEFKLDHDSLRGYLTEEQVEEFIQEARGQ